MTKNIHNIWRLFAAIIVTPILGAILTITAIEIYSSGGGGTGSDYTELLRIAIVFGAVIGWPAMLVLGLPIHSLLCRFKARHWAAYAFLGAVVGAIAALIASHFIFGVNLRYLLLDSFVLIIGCPTGAFAATLFHLIRGPHNRPEIAAAS